MLRAEHLFFSYGGTPTLGGVDLKVAKGELCAILGNNGAGKSTLLKCLAGILRPHEGTVYLDGTDAGCLSRKQKARFLAYVPQRDHVQSRLTVFDSVLMGRRPHIAWAAGERDLEIVEQVLEALGLGRLALRAVDALSGGEYQKVIIARALAQQPQVLLLDEPTSNLDLKNQLEVMQMVRRATDERGLCALMAIHDINLALRFSDSFLLLQAGTIRARGGPEVISPSNIESAYGVRVLVEERGSRRSIIPL
jgi:iron complex transport system ATP-binding protein